MALLARVQGSAEWVPVGGLKGNRLLCDRIQPWYLAVFGSSIDPRWVCPSPVRWVLHES